MKSSVTLTARRSVVCGGGTEDACAGGGVLLSTVWVDALGRFGIWNAFTGRLLKSVGTDGNGFDTKVRVWARSGGPETPIYPALVGAESAAGGGGGGGDVTEETGPDARAVSGVGRDTVLDVSAVAANV